MIKITKELLTKRLLKPLSLRIEPQTEPSPVHNLL